MVENGLHSTHIKCAGLELIFTDCARHLNKRSNGQSLHHSLAYNEMCIGRNYSVGGQNVNNRLMVGDDNASAGVIVKLIAFDLYVVYVFAKEPGDSFADRNYEFVRMSI